MLTYKKLWLSAATTRKIEKNYRLVKFNSPFSSMLWFSVFFRFWTKMPETKKVEDKAKREEFRRYLGKFFWFNVTSRRNFKTGLKTFFIQIKPESLTSWHSFWFRFMRSRRSRLMQLAIWKSPLVMVSFLSFKTQKLK